MAGELLKQECELVAELRSEGVLRDVDGHLLDQKDGVILITCSDGDRFFDIFQHQCRMQAEHRQGLDPRTHVFAWHGGALACAPCSPINKRDEDHLVFLNQITAARNMKQIDIVALYAHAPCGAACASGISLEESLLLQMQAKAEIKNLNRGIKVACFFAVDYDGCKKRTYFLSRENWEHWAKTRPTTDSTDSRLWASP